MCGHCSGTPYTPRTSSSPPACWRVTPQSSSWRMHAAISASAASVASGQQGFPAGASGQNNSQWTSPTSRADVPASSPSGSSAKLIATAVCEPLCGSAPIITAAINRSFVMSAGRTVAGMPNSGSAGVAPLTSHTTGDPTGRHLVIKPDRTRPAGGSGASPSGPLNATTKPQRLHPFSIRRVGARLSTIACPRTVIGIRPGAEMPRESAMPRLKAGSALRVAGPPARRLMIPVHLIAAEACPGSRHAGLDVLGEETRGRVVVDERLVSEPLDSSAAGTGVAEGIPRGQQVRVLLVQFVFEPAEGALALDSPRQPPPGSLVADLLGEVGHVLVPDV